MAAALVSVSYGLTVGTPSWTTSGRFVGLQSRRWRCCPYTWMMMFSLRCAVFHGTFAWGWKLVGIASRSTAPPQMMWKCVNELNSFDKFIFMYNICSRWNNYNIAHQTKKPIKGSSQKAGKCDFCTLRQTPLSRARFVVAYHHLQRDLFNKRLWVYKRPISDRWARMTPGFVMLLECTLYTCWCLT